MTVRWLLGVETPLMGEYVVELDRLVPVLDENRTSG